MEVKLKESKVKLLMKRMPNLKEVVPETINAGLEKVDKKVDLKKINKKIKKSIKKIMD